MKKHARIAQHPSRHGVALALVLAALVALAIPSAAQSRGSGTEADLEDTREQIGELDDKLEFLAMSDLELEIRLVDLRADIDVQQAAVADAVQAVAAAEAKIADLNVDLETTQRWADAQQILLNERAVAAYVSPKAEGRALMSETTSYTECHKMRVMVPQVAEHDRGTLA